MAIMPNVPFLGITSSEMMQRYDCLCIHTIVGYQSGGNAAHFTTGANGQIVQARDTVYQSDANLYGNYRVIAIENEDFGPAYGSWSGSDVPAFTPPQAEAIARICAWANQAYGIPLVPCPDSRSTSRGIAYHRQGIDGNYTDGYPGRVYGGEVWSKWFGKACPGLRRIQQIPSIIARARELAGITNGRELDMPSGSLEPRTDPANPGRVCITIPPVGAGGPVKAAKFHIGTGWGNTVQYKVWCVTQNGGYVGNKVPLSFTAQSDRPGYFWIPINASGINIEYTTSKDIDAGWHIELLY